MSGTYVLVVDVPRPTTLGSARWASARSTPVPTPTSAAPSAPAASPASNAVRARSDEVSLAPLARPPPRTRPRRPRDPLSGLAPTSSHSLRSRERHWHVDYPLGHGETRLETAITLPDADRECELAATLPDDPVDGFGASDCDCAGHLLAAPDAETVRTAAVAEGGRLE